MSRGLLTGVEWLSRAEMAALQLDRLKKQLRRVGASPFYRGRFAASGFDPSALRSLEQFAAEVPFTTKDDLIRDQELHPPFGTRLAVAESDVARFEVTSGTSGLGQEVYGLTWADMETVGSTAAWTLAMQGIGRGDRVAVSLPLGYLQGPWGGDWGARSLGCAIFHLGLAPDSETKLQYLRRFGINALYTPTPTYLMRLTRVAADLGLEPRRDLPDFRLAWLAGEPYPIEWAQRMQELWDVRLAEAYGSTQGAMAATCEHGVLRNRERGVLHNVDWNVLLEVLDPETDQPVRPGETGEAVITMLVREASPVIRFRTRDRVRLLPSEACPCGRQTIALEAGTIGRLDDMLKVKGMNIWPSAMDSVIFASGEIREYVAHVSLDDRGYERVQVRLATHAELAPGRRAALCESMATRLHAVTNVTMQVVFVEDGGTLPHFEYKAKRWIDTRPSDLARVRAGGSREP